MEKYSSSVFQDIRHERSRYFLLPLTLPDILKQDKLTDNKIKLLKNHASEKLHRQRLLKKNCSTNNRKVFSS